MRPVSTNSSANGTVWRVNSPIPYLFGGLTLMFVLITIALILLICSHRKQAPTSGDAGDGKRPERPDGTDEADLRPKILVIMAGNKKPTFLATPISCSTEKKSSDDLV